MIQGQRVVIRILEEPDLENVRKLRNDPTVNEFLTTNIPINEEAQKQWFRQLSLDGSRAYYVIDDLQKNFVGMVRTDQWDKINRSIRVGIDIVSSQRRKGFASEAYRVFLRYLFESLDMNRVWLEVLDYNSIALHLYQKLGFVKEGIMRQAVFRRGKYNDYVIMSLLKTEYEKK